MNAGILKHQSLCNACEEMGLNLIEFGSEMIVGARSIGNSISKTTALVKCWKSAVINIYRERIAKQKTGSQRPICGRHRLLNARSERRIAKVFRSNTPEQSYVKENWRETRGNNSYVDNSRPRREFNRFESQGVADNQRFDGRRRGGQSIIDSTIKVVRGIVLSGVRMIETDI
ncbi:hypothetical protein TNCV_2410421 [Trichonephila clavipes]|nr:hypothetical protein TNCV_2410421 [Trichonephila clavipes]